jgi:hypothetical protein
MLKNYLRAADNELIYLQVLGNTFQWGSIGVSTGEENSCRRGVREVPRRQSFLGNGTYQRAAFSISEIIPEKRTKRLGACSPPAEGEFCDAGLVEFPQARGDHAIVLRFGCLRERQVEARRAAQA